MNIVTYDDDCGQVHLCVNCDSEFNVVKIDDEELPVSFCPFCGYDMQDENDEEDDAEENWRTGADDF